MTHSLTQPQTTTAASFEIQPSSWRDLLSIQALERACFGPDAWNWLELLSLLFLNGIRLKALADGRLVGFVAGERKPAEGCAWIITIGVLPEYQRQGIGARLLAESEGLLNMPVIKLTVRESNQGAIALYRKYGYQPQYTVPRYYSGGENGVVMEKALNKTETGQHGNV
jgi:[ribosomal protein S18]-alanine N-acetyltransferase